jgi:hypothetical protein
MTEVVAGTRTDQSLRSSQVEVVAGERNHLNLRHQQGRPVGAADPRHLASQLAIVAQASNLFRLLFQVAA